VSTHTIQERLEIFLNDLEGEVISIFPNVHPTLQLMGAAAKVDVLLIV
jgi:hypothetical protein